MIRREIGVFDSGVGGLTVLKELKKVYPYDVFYYIGDTAHLPYGQKSSREVLGFVREGMEQFRRLRVKGAVIACNTATAAALPRIAQEFPFPILGVIAPAVQEVCHVTENGKVLLLATEGTVRSGAYEKGLKEEGPWISLESISCPHLVTAVEDGYGDHYIGAKIALDYIARAREPNFDTLVLGCTHFPVVQKKLEDYFLRTRRKVKVVNPAEASARRALEMISPEKKEVPQKTVYRVTANPRGFSQVATKILGEKVKASLL